MPVSSNAASASLLSDGSGSFATPPYYNGSFSGASVQFLHNSGNIERTGSGWGSFAWDTTFGPDCILIVKVGAIGEMELEIRGQQIGNSGTWDAYSLYYDNAGGWQLYRTINGTPSSALATASSVTPGVGDLIGFEAIGSGSSVVLAAARYTGGAWGSDFLTYTDTDGSRITSAGYVGAWANGTAFKIDELSAGDVSASGFTVSVGQVEETDSALAMTVVQGGVVAPAAPVGQAYRGAGTYPAGVLTVPGATIRVQPLDGVWETLGAGRLKGITPEAISPSWAYPWGDDQLRFSLKVADGATRPDLLPFTPVELEIAGQVVWVGRVIDVPTDDQDHQVTCQGWSYHLDDDAYEKAYVLSDMSGWRDMRSLLTTTLGEAGYCVAGQVSTGQGTVQVGFPDAYVAAAGASAGAILDLGPDSRAARVTIAWEGSNDNNAAPSILVDFIAADDPTGSGGQSLNGGPFALTTWGASGSFTVTPTTPSRYLILKLYNPGGGTHTMVGDAWIRFTSCIVYAATGYESGGASVLKASQVVADALTRAPLLNQDTSLIETTSFSIPEFATSGYVTPRQVVEGINAYEGYQHRVAGPDRRTLEYRPRPTSPLVEIGEWAGVQFSDGSVSGQEIFNKVIVQGAGPDGAPIVEKRTTADLSGAVFGLAAAAQPTNPGFEVDASGWTAATGTIARITFPVDLGLGCGQITNNGAGSFQVRTDSFTRPLLHGLRYRAVFRIRSTTDLGGSGSVALNACSGTGTTIGRFLATTTIPVGDLSTAAFRTFTLDFTTPGLLAGETNYLLEVRRAGSTGTSSAVALYIDNIELQVVDTTLPDRRQFPRCRTLPIRSAITDTVAQRFGDLWLAEKTRAPFAASITVTGNGVRRIIGGQTIPPWTLGNYIGEKLRVAHRVDPDTGAVGRDGRIVAVTYSVDTGQASITLDERRDSFERVLAKYEALVGRR